MNTTINTSDASQQNLFQNFKLLNKTLWIYLSLFSALLMNLSFPYPGFSFLAWVSLVPLFFVIMTCGFKKAILASLITGFAFNIIYILWMKEYKHPAALSGGVFTEMLFFFLSVTLSWILFSNSKIKKFKFLRVFALTAGWVTIDYLKTIGFLAFPWGILGYSQYKNLILIQSASVFGVWGVNFLIVYCNAALTSTLIEYISEKKIRINRVHLTIVIILGLITVLYGLRKIKEEKVRKFRTKRAALIQANFDPWSPQLEENIALEIELTRKALKYNPDFIVWTESSVPFPYEFYLSKNHTFAKIVHDFIVSVNKPFLFGSLEFAGTYENREFSGDYYNAGIFYNNGILSGVYRKIHLVPFGEWFPYGRIFPFVTIILDSAGAGAFTPGEDFMVFDAGDFKFSVLICFEDVFGNLTRKFIPGRTELFINITNDAWTGSEKAEVQHFSMAVFRTIETRRSLIRAANGGVTACINPYGRILRELNLFSSDFLICDVPIVEVDEVTIYSRYGDFFPQFILMLVIIEFIYIITKKVIDRIKKKNKM